MSIFFSSTLCQGTRRAGGLDHKLGLVVHHHNFLITNDDTIPRVS